ncbi:MAG: hypothetical protein IPM64_09755 [Phycisphaerales bacterium]|nr:hypothetical protein [Phycisphaerales bacterium]
MISSLSPRRIFSICSVMVLGALLSGCGYTIGGPYRGDARSVCVEMFTSKEFRRDIEFELTEAVKKRVSLDTPYRLASRSSADTILKGEVLEQNVAAYAPDRLSRLAREKTVTLAVRIEWKHLRTGQVLVDRPVLLQAADYLPAAGEPENFAREKAIDRLAARIVQQMYDEEW